MRFVDVPAGRHNPSPAPESVQDPASIEGSPVGFHSAVALDTSDRAERRAQASPPDPASRQERTSNRDDDTPRPTLRVEMPPGARSRRRSGLARLIRRLWSSARWSLSTWMHRRARSARLLADRTRRAARATEPEPAYVTFANG